MKRLITVIILISILSSSLPFPARAEAWGTNIGAAIWQVETERMLENIQKQVVASVKITAIRVIQGRLNVLLTGSCGRYCIGGDGAMFITDWQDFIFGSAQRTADMVVNDFFTGLRSGTTSAMQRVLDNAQTALDAEVELAKRPPDLQNYVAEGKASLIFDPTTRNNWMAWRKAAEPQNDLASIWLRARAAQREAYRQEEEKRKAQGIAGQGFPGVETKESNRGPYAATSSQGGRVTVPPGSDWTPSSKVTLPGSIVRDLTAETQLMGLKMLTLAQSIPEIATAMVAQTLTNLLNYGIRQVTDPIDRSLMEFRNQTGTQIWNVQNQIQQGARENIYFNRR